VKEDIEGFAIAGFFLALMLGVSFLIGRKSSTSHDYDGAYDLPRCSSSYYTRRLRT